jgi:hypothetical protein
MDLCNVGRAVGAISVAVVLGIIDLEGLGQSIY